MIATAQIRIFSLIFFLSGATSLIYQVGWMRKLSLFFGSDVYSAAVTLAAFMGGLGLGGWLAGRWARGLARPLLAYGVLEILIAFYAVAFAAILTAFDPLLALAYQANYATSPAIYQVARLAVAFAVLLPPTILMGATLPLVIQHFAVSQGVLGARVGHFYAMNTFGALAGTLFGGFILLPQAGVLLSIGITAAVNLAIGLGAISLALQAGPIATELSSPPARSESDSTDKARRLVPLALGISGFAALAMEVVWMRSLVQSFSATVYAFSIMLAVFLLGIFVGSEREAASVDARDRPAERLVLLETALFAYIALLAVLTYFVPGFFGTLLWGLTALTGSNFATASILAQALAAGLLIFAPTIWLGATFPLAIKVYTRDIRNRAADTGQIYAANTLGGLLGALAAGFILIPLVGARAALVVIAGTFLLAAYVLSSLVEQPVDKRSHALRSLGLVSGSIFALVAVFLPRQIVANFNMQGTTRPEVVYRGEGIAHTVDIIRTRRGETVMLVNGNAEADTTLVQRRHFILNAHLPLLLHENPKQVAVIGLGLGITLSAAARNPAVEQIRLVELSPEMVAAHANLRDITGDVLASPKIRLLIDDGRNFLNRSRELFDMITTDPIHPRISGVGYLYSHEYYTALRTHLRPGGYILHWMPMYAISRQSFDVAFRTFAGAFPHASFWYVRGHGQFVAGLQPLKLDFAALTARFNHPVVRRDLESIGINSPHELLGHLLMDDAHIARYLGSAAAIGKAINTDDNAYLEYSTPYEFLHPTSAIIESLKAFAGWDRSRLSNASPADIAAINAASAARLKLLIEELGHPVE